MQDTVQAPTSHWIGESVWIPAEGSRAFTTDELREIFSQECTLFVGDSLQRRAADTLHLMLQTGSSSTPSNITNTTKSPLHTAVVDEAVFTDEFFRQKKHDRGFAKRSIWSQENSDIDQPRRGCIDTDWRPLLSDVQQFVADFTLHNQTLYQDYTLIIVGSTIWDVVGSSKQKTSAAQIRSDVNATIQELCKLPDHVKIIWKTSGWCENCGWTPQEDHLSRGDNYKVFAANQAAQRAIEILNRSDRFASVDWGREVLPKSLMEHRLKSNDGNPYHYGLVPRIVALQMIAQTMMEWQTTPMPPPSIETIWQRRENLHDRIPNWQVSARRNVLFHQITIIAVLIIFLRPLRCMRRLLGGRPPNHRQGRLS